MVAGLLGVACSRTAPARHPTATPAQDGPGDTSPPRAVLPKDVVARAALPFYGQTSDERLEEQALWSRLEAASVVCLGERHDSAPHHWVQQQVLERLARRANAAEKPLALGLEMFQRPFQDGLSGFVDGQLTEEELLAHTEYEKRWGFDFSLYRPLLTVAREFGLPALALNAPREVTRTVGRGGLAALSEEQRAALPKLDLEDAAHRKYFEQAVGAHPMPPGGPTLDDMYTAQVIWDETMADSATQWLEQQAEGAQLLILAGSGHCHRSAIPARIVRRTGLEVLSVNPILSSELAAQPQSSSRYDLWLVLEDEQSGS